MGIMVSGRAVPTAASTGKAHRREVIASEISSPRAERAAMPFHLACEEIGSVLGVVFVEDCLGVGAHEFYVGFDVGVVMMTIPPTV
jgi:hypothetical protein